MNRSQFNKLISFIQKGGWQVYGPQENGGEAVVDLINKPASFVLDERLPFFSFKRFFVPEKEDLLEYKQGKFSQSSLEAEKQAIVGMNILDLRSILLYDQVFEKDPYYQARRQANLVIGHSIVPPIGNNIFEEKYEEDILEHLSFDIFLGVITPDKFEVFSGSAKGRNILDSFGYGGYRHVQFSGPAREEGNERMKEIKERMSEHYNPAVWEKLGDICLECGKCTVICPTCFCFRIDDCPALKKGEGKRTRSWDSCFYQEFSEVAGGHKFLDSTAKKIHFWYYHKFVRIPEEYSMVGCVGCGRCYTVCPVRINIRKILKEL